MCYGECFSNVSTVNSFQIHDMHQQTVSMPCAKVDALPVQKVIELDQFPVCKSGVLHSPPCVMEERVN